MLFVFSLFVLLPLLWEQDSFSFVLVWVSLFSVSKLPQWYLHFRLSETKHFPQVSRLWQPWLGGEYSLNWPGQMSLAQLTTSVRGVCGTAKRQWWCFSSVCSPAPVCLVLSDSELKLGFAFWKPWNPKAPNHFLSSEKSLGLLVSVKCSAFGFWENSHLIALSLYCHKHMKPCLQSGAIT